ncbi:hypothetical protein D3C80_1784770 [compost metagenome]
MEQLRTQLEEERIPEETGSEVSGGFGLHNVQQRIRLYYGAAYGVKIDSEHQIGTKVTLCIPMKRG